MLPICENSISLAFKAHFELVQKKKARQMFSVDGVPQKNSIFYHVYTHAPQ
jgi:hypothetical protein